MSKEVLEEDKIIESYRLVFNPGRVGMAPVEQAFQR
jgi:hypothetical protein